MPWCWATYAHAVATPGNNAVSGSGRLRRPPLKPVLLPPAPRELADELPSAAEPPNVPGPIRKPLNVIRHVPRMRRTWDGVPLNAEVDCGSRLHDEVLRLPWAPCLPGASPESYPPQPQPRMGKCSNGACSAVREFKPNHLLKQFSLARQLAYDPGRGRLWVIFRQCGRWCLVPIESRWEAVEELEAVAERIGLTARTDGIGLVTQQGVRILRVGAGGVRQEAWWRYGREFRI